MGSSEQPSGFGLADLTTVKRNVLFGLLLRIEENKHSRIENAHFGYFLPKRPGRSSLWIFYYRNEDLAEWGRLILDFLFYSNGSK